MVFSINDAPNELGSQWFSNDALNVFPKFQCVPQAVPNSHHI